MRKLSITDILASLVVVAGLGAAMAFALSAPRFGGVALGAGMVLLAALVRSVVRDLGRAQIKIMAAVGDSGKRVKALENESQEVALKVDSVLKAHRKSDQIAVAQGDRIEQRTDSMVRRILVDINAARLEAADRSGRPPADGART